MSTIHNETWVRVDRNRDTILFEGPYKEALEYGEGHFMTKRFYQQYKEEMADLMKKI
jgi:hypothetical protein